jgi:hypothetical protein
MSRELRKALFICAKESETYSFIKHVDDGTTIEKEIALDKFDDVVGVIGKYSKSDDLTYEFYEIEAHNVIIRDIPGTACFEIHSRLP